MATTNVTNSTLFVFKAGSAGSVQVSHLTDFTISDSMEPRDITTKDSGGHRYLLEGLRSYELSIAGLVAFDATLGVYTSSTGIRTILQARTVQTWIAGTGVSGDPKLSGDGYWTSLEVSSPDSEANCTFSATLQGTGQYYQGTF